MWKPDPRSGSLPALAMATGTATASLFDLERPLGHCPLQLPGLEDCWDGVT